MKQFKFYIYIILILTTSCDLTESKQSNQDSNKLKDSMESSLNSLSRSKRMASDNTKKEKLHLPKSTVILGGDTIIVNDNGKVFELTALNDSVYYYKLFKKSKPESDIGLTEIKVKNKIDQLLWKMPIKDEIVLNNKNDLITVDLNSRCIKYYSIFNGRLNKDLCLPSKYTFSDANDFIATQQGLYIKLVDENDYSFKDILFVDKNSSALKLMNLEAQGYLKLQRVNSQVVLINSEGEVVKNIE